MTTEIATKMEFHLGFPGCTFTPTSLAIDQELAFEEWLDLCGRLKQMQGATLWWLGDAQRYGRKRYEDKLKGEKQSEFEFAASCVPAKNRMPALPFAYHQEVQDLEPKDQVKWLKAALEHNLSRRALRASISLGRVLTDKDLDDMQGRGSGIKESIEGIMIDLRKWIDREAKATPLKEWTTEKLDALETELRPAGELWVEVKKERDYRGDIP